MSSEKLPVDEKGLIQALKYLRDLRAWGVRRNVDPWAIRQALIMVMAMDTHAALDRGVTAFDLNAFDMAAKVKAREFIETIPEELRI